jgi:hypothetical protein
MFIKTMRHAALRWRDPRPFWPDSGLGPWALRRAGSDAIGSGKRACLTGDGGAGELLPRPLEIPRDLREKRVTSGIDRSGDCPTRARGERGQHRCTIATPGTVMPGRKRRSLNSSPAEADRFRDEFPPGVKLTRYIREQSFASAVGTCLFRLLCVCILLSLTLPSPSPAGTVDTPIGNRDLAEADRLIHAIRLRENNVQQGDWAGLCRLLRQNHKDMSRARDLMNPCLTGHDHGENIGQIDVSLEDIRYVLDTRCGRRGSHMAPHQSGGAPVAGGVDHAEYGSRAGRRARPRPCRLSAWRAREKAMGISSP